MCSSFDWRVDATDNEYAKTRRQNALLQAHDALSTLARGFAPSDECERCCRRRRRGRRERRRWRWCLGPVSAHVARSCPRLGESRSRLSREQEKLGKLMHALRPKKDDE